MMFKIILPLLLLTLTNGHKLTEQRLFKAQSRQNNEHMEYSHLFLGEQTSRVNHMLHLLAVQNIKPTRSLCIENNMTVCGNTCCKLQSQLHHHRQFSASQKHIQQICQTTGRSLCGNACCLQHLCDRSARQSQTNEGLQFNLRFVSDICHEDSEQVREQQCRQAGLLWCDGECCGFSNSNHKCFRANHYGTPFIRCPIEDPSQQQQLQL